LATGFPVARVLENVAFFWISAAARQRWRWFVAGKEIAVKKYVVKLGAEERERLEALVRAGKSPQLLTRARILLKADVSEAGEGWSDSAIAAAPDTSINNVARTRQQLVEEGFEATLKRKYNPNSARPRIFDGRRWRYC
jgi:hypothetical protein